MISAVILCLFALTNLPWQLDDYDQAQQAFTSFEMIKEGHWFFQRTPHELIAQKPPLVGWASAAIFAVTRSWDIAWRLPSFVTAVVLATILFRAAMAAYGAAAALIALGAFGLNLLTVRLATLVRTDMPLALVIFLIGLLNLAENSRTRAVAAARPMENVGSTHGLHVHQRADRIRVCASRHRVVSMARRKIENGKCMVWLVAMDWVSGPVFDMGNLRHQVRPRLL